ncbi:MAG: enoyl-CoA hydratase/isomerase family protein [Saprospiraceae bacterium]|nr:enoyl-CoA hydratase/isomerase family protein [Saprospiraceae bacterium]
MTYQNLQIEETDGIVLITINREKALNALNKQTMQELRHFFGADGLEREGIKGVILTGAGEKAFVAGADIKEFMGLGDSGGQALAEYGQEVFFMVERFPHPVIAAVNGFALGGGCELAMACHLRIAGPNARFGQPEVNLGIIPGYGGTQRLIQYIGKTKAMELLLTADMIGADEALQLGLVNKVVEAGAEVEASRKMLQKIATKGPVAISKIIETVNAYFAVDQDGFQTEVSAFGATTRTADFVEGATAFVEKRKADFKGV